MLKSIWIYDFHEKENIEIVIHLIIKVENSNVRDYRCTFGI